MASKSRLVTVSPFEILIDTKEQKPWTFRGIPGNTGQGSILVKWYWESLGTGNGDYSIRGFIDSDGTPRVSIERKSLGDLYSTIISRLRILLGNLSSSTIWNMLPLSLRLTLTR